MDPFDRTILLCEKILCMLSGLVKQPEDSGGDQELANGCGNSANGPDSVMPARCSTLGLSRNFLDFEAVDSSRQSGIVSTVSPGPVGARAPSSMQQLGILKPDKHTPASCSTVVLAMGFDAMRAKRGTKTEQVGLVYIRTTAAVFPATMPPHPPDQPRLLLDRPPPWPPWKVTSMLCTTHGTKWLLPIPSCPPDSIWKTTMLLCSVENGQKHPWFWLLTPSACGQAEIQGEVKRVCTCPFATLPHTLTCPRVQLPETVLSASHNACLAFSILPKVTTTCIKGSSCFHLGNNPGMSMVVKETSPWSKCFFSFVGVHRTTHVRFEHQPSWQGSGKSEKWIPTVGGCATTGSTCWFASKQITYSWQQTQCHLHMTVSDTPRLSIFTQTFVADGIECAEFFAPHSRLHEIVHGVNSNSENMLHMMLPVLSAAWATCENLLSSPSIDFVAFYGMGNGGLVMLSITIPWDLGVCNKLSTEVLQSKLVEQHASGEDHLGKHRYIAYLSHERIICRIDNQQLSYWVLYVWALGNSMSTENLRSWFVEQQSGELLVSASSRDSFACCKWTWAVYSDYLGKCREISQWFIHGMFYLVCQQLQICIVGSDTENVVCFGTQRIAGKALLDDSVRCGELEHGENMKLQCLGELLTGLLTPRKGFLEQLWPGLSLAPATINNTRVMAVNNNKITVGKHFVQVDANRCPGSFLSWGMYVYPMDAWLPQHEDQVDCVHNSSITLPWVPDQICQIELCFTHPIGKQLKHSPSDKLHQLPDDVRRSWDPGSTSVDRLGGKPVFKGEGMSRTGPWTAQRVCWVGLVMDLTCKWAQETESRQTRSKIKGAAPRRRRGNGINEYDISETSLPPSLLPPL